jgi:hypothetical protein
MKTAAIEQIGSFSESEQVSQQELIRRIAELEQEKAECKLAAHEHVQKCEAQCNAMLESVDAHMTLVDRNLVILWANERAKKIFGHDIVGKSCCEALYGKKELCCDPSSCLTPELFHGIMTAHLLWWSKFTRILPDASRPKRNYASI